MRHKLPSPATSHPDGSDVGRHELRTDADARNEIVRFVAQVFVVATLSIWAARLAASFAPKLILSLLLAAAGGYGVIGVAKAIFHAKVRGLPLAYAGIMIVGTVCVLAFDLLPSGPLGFMSYNGALFLGAALATAFVGRLCDRTTEDVHQYVAFGYAAAALLLALCVLPGGSPLVAMAFTCAAVAANLLLWFHVLDVYAGFVLAHPEHTAEKLQAERTWWRAKRKEVMLLTLSAIGMLALLVGFAALRSASPAKGFAMPHWGPIGFCLLICLLVAGIVEALVRSGRPVWRSVLVWRFYSDEEEPGIYKPKGALGSTRIRQVLLAAAIALSVLQARVQYSSYDTVLAANCVSVVRLVQTDPSVIVMLADYGFSFVFPLLVFAFPMMFFSTDFRDLHRRVEEAQPDEPYRRKEPR